MKRTLLAIGLLCAGLAQAQPPAPGEQRGDGHRPPERTITREEFLANAAKRFDEMDTNHDGKFDPQERRAFMEKMRAMHEGHRGGPGGDAPPDAAY